ncbi:hypothetical protein G4B88_030998 [Cannabis sativa]|uniref:Purple acid phosphatase n=1 Tax=Cannabis sativa TaxID=3483 RepID=A0A7J6GMI6_CANSA|nr:hypothetical protein G4B88_030998 [Cannabis sativa]
MNQLRVIFYTNISVSIFLFLSSLIILEAKNDNFIRFPPGKMVFPPNKRSDSDPQQVHISLMGKDHMRVSWSTNEHFHTQSIVEYGIRPNEYNVTATGEYTSYRYFFYSSGKIHHVTIGPLEPATTYYYRCGGSGPEFSFRTPPAAFPLQFVVVGDLGQTEWTASTLKHIDSKNYDVLLLPGDLSYADTHQPLWDSFGRLVEPYASRRPWMVTQGNHEVETIPIIFPHPFKAYNARWPMPYLQSASTSNLYYSFEIAGSHVIMLGSYTDFDSDSDQFKWLAADLAGIDRVKTPWVFALVHAPWYNTNLAHRGEGESMRKALEELLYKARVDVVFAGHVHAYERFTRIYDNKAESCGPMYVTIGDGGNREGLALAFENPPSPLSLFREASFGHGRLNVVNETHAHWSWHRNNDLDSVEADHLWFQSLSTTTNCCHQNSQSPSSSTTHNDEL